MTHFKTVSTLFILAIFLAISCSPKQEISNAIDTLEQDTLNGIYIGLEEMTDQIDPSKPEWKWFHLSYLKIEGDGVFLDQSPVSIYKKDTLFSASDGGFYYYRGKLSKADTALTINLKEISCDYCGQFMMKSADGSLVRVYGNKNYVATLTNKGILINHYLFTKKNNVEYLISEHSRAPVQQ